MDKSPKTKRLRVFAGPNGSGKTTLATELLNQGKFHLKIFVNADDIERQIKDNGSLVLSAYQIKTTTKKLRGFILDKGMSLNKLQDQSVLQKIRVDKNHILYDGAINSYVAADIASYIRETLLIKGISFGFETVFSHESKLEFMEKAKEMGYRVYFYFLATEHPDINVDRVDIRVNKEGHSVHPKKITDRYYRSLDLMSQK